jgi:acetate kinase
VPSASRLAGLAGLGSEFSGVGVDGLEGDLVAEAFHATIPPAASTYALPSSWRQRWALRRYGFHGLSHAYASQRAASLLGATGGFRVVTCHLGAGASLAAVFDGKSVDTTMGFTSLEGLVMATRSGTVDPGLLLWLEEHVGLKPHELAEMLESHSGLVGLAGTGDMRRCDEKPERTASLQGSRAPRYRASPATNEK